MGFGSWFLPWNVWLTVPIRGGILGLGSELMGVNGGVWVRINGGECTGRGIKQTPKPVHTGSECILAFETLFLCYRYTPSRMGSVEFEGNIG